MTSFPAWSLAVFTCIAAVPIGGVTWLNLRLWCQSRRLARRAAESAEQILKWEAEGYPYLPYMTTWYEDTGYTWRHTPEYWPEIAEQAAAASRSGRYDRVTVRLLTRVAGGYVTEWTWKGGELVSEQRQPFRGIPSPEI